MPESKDPENIGATNADEGNFHMSAKFWVYIVASISGTLYIGITNDLARRARQHKAHEIAGFTAKYNCTRLLYFESCDNPLKAISREKQLKGWRRSRKTALIESANPRWQDLAEKWGAEMLFAPQSMAAS